ncbi:YagK/YfjJ domain-containing protein [Undibacterium sp. JH2W]|uniref:YagK/YfjJ domain-containing protein n=1 Tax=Undibacterium sp. JH2W TaxID=3413037 RepID=UPI003BF3FE85
MNEKIKWEIGEALCASTFAYANIGEKVNLAITEENSIAYGIRRLETVVTRLAKTNGNLFSEKKEKNIQFSYLHATPLGLEILKALQFDVVNLKIYFPMHCFNPFLELFFRHAEIRNLLGNSFGKKNQDVADLIVQIETLNAFGQAVRNDSRSSDFKNVLNNYHRSSNKNSKEMMAYVKSLFLQHSRLKIIRIDLGYQIPKRWPAVHDRGVTPTVVKGHREKLQRFLRAKLAKEGVIGFAWKLEYGLEKSFQYHLIVFLDGTKMHQDDNIAKMIGEQWEVNSDGRGLYYNCNAYKSGYKKSGIGTVNSSDLGAMHGLQRAIRYMTKTDYYIKLVLPEKGRTFGKGNMPNPNSGKATAKAGHMRTTAQAQET